MNYLESFLMCIFFSIGISKSLSNWGDGGTDTIDKPHLDTISISISISFTLIVKTIVTEHHEVQVAHRSLFYVT